jgi:hypothetical protein
MAQDDRVRALATPSSQRDERVVPLVSIVPSMFVPLLGDITEVDMPQDPTEESQRFLDVVKSQRASVMDNMVYLIDREHDRILVEGREKEEASGSDGPWPAMSPEERDWMISNMEERPKPGMDYNIKDMSPPILSGAAPGLTIREETTRNLLGLVEQAVRQIKGYNGHIQKIKPGGLSGPDKTRQQVDMRAEKPYVSS